MVIPGHIIFTYGIRFLQGGAKAGHTTITPNFLVIYLFAALLQVVLLLYFAHSMILWMWKKSIDPGMGSYNHSFNENLIEIWFEL
jgi:solute carrier family 41